MFEKQRKLFERLDEFMDVVGETIARFHEAIQYTLENGADDRFDVMASEISEKEQVCDDVRRKLERDMFRQSLLPETREDLLQLVESMDQIPNHCETVAFMISDQKTRIIPTIHDEIMELIRISGESCELTIKAIKDCFGSMNDIPALVRKIDDYENIGNEVERGMVRKIFSEEELKPHPGGQLAQKEIVKAIGEMLDICRHISEKIIITAIKRSI
jgi:hypothetical protein